MLLLALPHLFEMNDLTYLPSDAFQFIGTWYSRLAERLTQD